MTTYYHLRSEERVFLMLERQRGTSLRSIAEQLDRSPSTLCRELKRNQPDKRAYCATQAAKAYNIRRKSSVKPRKLSRGRTLCDIDEALEDIGNDGEFNLALLTIHPKGLRQYITNWDQAAPPFIHRLKASH